MSVAVAVPPVAAAAVKLISVMPGTAALVMVALTTVPSGSVALTEVDVAVPSVVLSGLGQVVVMAWFTTPGVGALARFCGSLGLIS